MNPLRPIYTKDDNYWKTKSKSTPQIYWYRQINIIVGIHFQLMNDTKILLPDYNLPDFREPENLNRQLTKL